MFYAPLDSLAISLATAVKNPPTIRQFSFNAALPDMSGDLGIGNHHGESLFLYFLSYLSSKRVLIARFG